MLLDGDGIGRRDAEAMSFAGVEFRECGFDEAEDRFGIGGELAIEDPAGDGEGEFHGVIFGFGTDPFAHACEFGDDGVESVQHGVEFLLRALGGGCFSGSEALIVGRADADFGFLLKFGDSQLGWRFDGSRTVGLRSLASCGAPGNRSRFDTVFRAQDFRGHTVPRRCPSG